MMKNFINLIREWREFKKFRQSVKNMEKFNITISEQDFKRWFLEPHGKAYFDLLLELLNNEMRNVFTGQMSVKNFEEFLYLLKQ